MKCEGMPTQRLEGKRVEERVGEEREREGEREKERTHAGEKESALASPFICFPPPGLPYANWA